MATRRAAHHQRSNKTYVVFKGRIPGIYDNWPDCQAQVNGFSGQSYKAYSTRSAAEDAWFSHMGSHYLSQPVALAEPANAAQSANIGEVAMHHTVGGIPEAMPIVVGTPQRDTFWPVAVVLALLFAIVFGLVLVKLM